MVKYDRIAIVSINRETDWKRQETTNYFAVSSKIVFHGEYTAEMAALRQKDEEGDGTVMKIVICDDRIEDLLKIEKLLLKYMESHPQTDFVTEKYSDPCALYRKIRDKELADIYLLDMVMAEKNGVDIGYQIRKCGAQPVIIYITSSDDFALDAYGVHAVRYLIKPVREEDFFEAFGYAISCSKTTEEEIFLIKTKGGLLSLPYSRIEFIENTSRMLSVHLTNGETVRSIFIRKSFDEEIGELIADRQFIKVHKSFLINLRYVKKLNQHDVIMESGNTIPISKLKIADVKKEYLSFVVEKYQ